MRSIRRTLLFNGTFFLAMTIGAASYLVYRTSVAAVKDKEQAERARAAAEFRAGRDEALLNEARTLAREAEPRLDLDRMRGHVAATQLGVVTAALNPAGHLQTPVWLLENLPGWVGWASTRPTPARPWPSSCTRTTSAATAARRRKNTSRSTAPGAGSGAPGRCSRPTRRCRCRPTTGRRPRTSSSRGTTTSKSAPAPRPGGWSSRLRCRSSCRRRPPSRGRRRSRPRRRCGRSSPAARPWSCASDRPDRPRGGGRGPNNGPFPPFFGFTPPTMYVQCAWPDDGGHPKLVQLTGQREAKLEEIGAQTAATLAALRTRLAAVGGAVRGDDLPGRRAARRPRPAAPEAPVPRRRRDLVEGLPAAARPLGPAGRGRPGRRPAPGDAGPAPRGVRPREAGRRPTSPTNSAPPSPPSPTTLDVALRKPRPAEPYRATLDDCRGIAREMSRLVERMLDPGLARRRAPPRPARRTSTSASWPDGCAAVGPAAGRGPGADVLASAGRPASKSAPTRTSSARWS